MTQPLNAYLKDKVENKLHELVCSGKLPLEQAQREIASNWVEAYKKYVGPLPATPPGAAQASAATPATDTRPAPRPAATAGTPAGSCSVEAPIKVSRSGIYHLLGTPQYDVTKAQACFAIPQAAEAAGYRAPKR